MEFKISFSLSQHPTLDKPLHFLHGLTLSVYSVYSRLLGAPLRGSRSLGFLDFVSLSG